MIDPSERLATVFGGSGFIGRYACEYLLKAGVRLRVAVRDPRQAFFLQPLAPVGRFGAVRADVTNRDSVARAVEGSDFVVYLPGVFKNMQAIHVTGAATVAEAAREAGAQSLVHVSAIGADASSDSDYGRTKGEGEAAVRKAFPTATILRPSLVFGAEDDLTNRFARMAKLPLLPVLASATRFQPVYVRDLGRAIAAAALDPAAHGGKTYEIAGPQVLSMEQLHRAVIRETGQSTELLPLPNIAGDILSRLGFLPGAPLSRDQWKMLQHDNVAAPKAPGLDAFGIDPTPLAAVAGEWLGRYSGRSRFEGRRPGASQSA